MDTVITFTPASLWQAILAICAAVSVIAVAVGHVIKAVNAAKAPGQKTQDRIKALEDKSEKYDEFFRKDKERLDAIEEGNRVTQKAILALLSHGIDGNDVESMKKAKEELQQFLIDK